MAQQAGDRSFEFGICVSLIGHVLIAIVMFTEIFGASSRMGPPAIYSVTLEGGKNLGGISQLPDPNKKTQIAPAKNVQAPPEKTEAKKEEKVEPEVKKEEPQPKPEDAEVSTNEKKKEVPKKSEKKPVEESKKTKTDEKSPKKNEDEKKVKEKPVVKSDSADTNKKLQQAMQRYLGESSDAGGKGFGAASLGGTAMGGGIVMPEIALRYQKIIHDRTKEGWRWYNTANEIFAQVTFDIARDGTISNVRIAKSSGNSEFDDSVERAVMKASPLPAPPAEVYEKWFRSVRMTFDPRQP